LTFTIFAPESKFFVLDLFRRIAHAVPFAKVGSIHPQGARYDDERFHVIARGKAAMAKYPVAALATLSGHDENRPLLVESLDCFHVGYQYWDDLVDWKEDMASSKCSLLLTRAFDRLTPEERKGSPDQVRERIGHTVYYSGLADGNLDQSHKWLQRSHDLSIEAGCTVWANYLKKLQKQIAVLANDLRSITTGTVGDRAVNV
jgi:hypothetical protein